MWHGTAGSTREDDRHVQFDGDNTSDGDPLDDASEERRAQRHKSVYQKLHIQSIAGPTRVLKCQAKIVHVNWRFLHITLSVIGQDNMVLYFAYFTSN